MICSIPSDVGVRGFKSGLCVVHKEGLLVRLFLDIAGRRR
jgi:hypothetical protein